VKVRSIIARLFVIVLIVLTATPVVRASNTPPGPASALPTSPGDEHVMLPLVRQVTSGTLYYVDSENGSDSNSGVSWEHPWKTLDPVRRHDFQPGDVIHFKAGSRWSGGLTINDAGTPDAPIRFTVYGEGARPAITNPGNPDYLSQIIRIEADWVVVEGLLLHDAQEAGVFVRGDVEHSVVRDVEIVDTGIGVVVEGQHNIIENCYIHDLHMVVNTRGGDDDYGAVGIYLKNAFNEVSHNVLLRCKAQSFDYERDGGGVEVYGYVDNSYIHHNWIQECDGFIEVGGGHAYDIVVAYNVCLNNERALHFNVGNAHASEVKNFRFENNTIVEHGGWQPINFIQGSLEREDLVVRNNIFYGFRRLAPDTDFIHTHNLYEGLEFVHSLGAGEMLDDPRFVDGPARDFRLLPGSPAIDAGLDLQYDRDYDSRRVPIGAAPDLGAFEHANIIENAYRIPLYRGWNLISVPQPPQDHTLQTLLGDSDAVIESVYTYQAGNHLDAWDLFVPQSLTLPYNLPYINEAVGLWVYVPDKGVLTGSRYETMITEVPLHYGWNLVGYPRYEPKRVSVALANIEDKYEVIYTYDPTDSADPWQEYDVKVPAEQNDFRELEPHRGYWIWVNEPCIWRPQ
jgi:hypothetical protein